MVDVLLSLTTDMEINPDGGFNKLLVSRDPDMTQALSAVFSRCPAVAARLTLTLTEARRRWSTTRCGWSCVRSWNLLKAGCS